MWPPLIIWGWNIQTCCVPRGRENHNSMVNPNDYQLHTTLNQNSISNLDILLYDCIPVILIPTMYVQLFCLLTLLTLMTFTYFLIQPFNPMVSLSFLYSPRTHAPLSDPKCEYPMFWSQPPVLLLLSVWLSVHFFTQLLE